MKILVSWLRDFVDVDATVQDLADVLTMRGFEVSAIEPAPAAVRSKVEDAVLDLEITTNRPDCLSVVGIAREVSTIYRTALRSPTASIDGDVPGETADAGVSVTIEAQDLCPRYAATAVDVTIGPSPAWLAARLEAAGVRPINNVVDVTNYVMLELGHPIHAFDLDALTGQEIRVRRAKPGETIRTLDTQTRTLDPDMLVIADAERPQAVAGVMGGAHSEVSGATRVVAFESAYFLPTSVRRTSKRLALSTDASYRFERGIDIEAPVLAMRRALTLLVELGACQKRRPIIDVYARPRTPLVIGFRHARIARVLGVDVEPTFVPDTLERLGFTVEPEPVDNAVENDGARWNVTVPTHRVDVSREVDLIEEIARHFGYDQLPATFPPASQAPAPQDDWQRLQRLLRRILTASGCSEAITYSFVEHAAARPFADSDDDIVHMANPLSEKHSVLRPSLLPGLIDALVRNRRREHRDVRLFEIGNRFGRHDGESRGLAVAITGARVPEHWSVADLAVDLFDVRGIVERTCAACGVEPIFAAMEHAVLVPGRTASVCGVSRHDDGQTVPLGYLGQLAPDLADARGLPSTGGEVYVAELDLAALESVAADRNQLKAEPVPRHPSVVRDLSLVVDEHLPAAAVRDTILAAAADTLVDVREFDRYTGKGIPENCVSLALHLRFRALDRTLTDTEVQASIDRVVAALKRDHGVTLR